MKYITFIVITILLFSCQKKENCLPDTLIEKLNVFKFELADSLSVPTNQLNLVDKLIVESTKRKRISLDLIEFDSTEIESLILCYSNDVSQISDSNLIRWQVNNKNQQGITINSLEGYSKREELLVLFWLYHIIDKSIISNTIFMKNDEEVYLNGILLNKINDLRYLLIIDNPNIKGFKERAVISIIGHKDSVSMDLVDKIENELREVDALRINYSTISRPL